MCDHELCVNLDLKMNLNFVDKVTCVLYVTCVSAKQLISVNSNDKCK